ncbi:UNVERIFIED_CONTAM: AraC family transcriptional regulator, partial [Bacteroidetes bacterium 56_B9]
HIRQKDEQLRNSFIIQTLLGCAFALALVLLWLAVRHINTIKKKNQLIAGKLDSLMSYEEELEKLHRQIDESKISVAEEQEREESINKDLFRKMERIIKDEKLYLMPELVRQDMLAR